ncbi:MAG: hypothetical protein U0Q10_04875 [Dermatophilaceae bacterium]
MDVTDRSQACLTTGVGAGDHLALVVVEGVLLLGEDARHHVTGAVIPLDLLIRRLGDEVAADLDVVLPRRPELADLFTIGRQAGGLEEIGAITDGQTADVGAETDEAAVGRGGLLDLGRRPLGRVDALVVEVDELLALAEIAGNLADLDDFDVGGAGPCRQVRLQIVVVGPVVGPVLLDGDVGVRSGVRVIHALGEGVAEDVDRQRHLLGASGRSGGARGGACR